MVWGEKTIRVWFNAHGPVGLRWSTDKCIWANGLAKGVSDELFDQEQDGDGEAGVPAKKKAKKLSQTEDL